MLGVTPDRAAHVGNLLSSDVGGAHATGLQLTRLSEGSDLDPELSHAINSLHLPIDWWVGGELPCEFPPSSVKSSNSWPRRLQYPGKKPTGSAIRVSVSNPFTRVVLSMARSYAGQRSANITQLPARR